MTTTSRAVCDNRDKQETSEKPSADEAATASLAYALWDSENTVRMEAGEINRHVDRANSVRHWLRVHGHDVARQPKDGEPTFEERYRYLRDEARAFIKMTKVRIKMHRERKRYGAAKALEEAIRSWQAALHDDATGKLWPICEVCGYPIKNEAQRAYSDDGCDFHIACVDG